MPPEVTGAIEKQLRQQQASEGNIEEIEVGAAQMQMTQL